MKQVTMYTDGACKGNPGKGGWGCRLEYGQHHLEIYGGENNTTNNKMELTAALRGLEKLTEPCSVTIYTDSQYVKNGMEKWVQGWIKRGWKTAGGDTVKNLEVWQALNQEASKHEVSWVLVKGHAGHPGNERADALANMGVDSCS